MILYGRAIDLQQVAHHLFFSNILNDGFPVQILLEMCFLFWSVEFRIAIRSVHQIVGNVIVRIELVVLVDLVVDESADMVELVVVGDVCRDFVQLFIQRFANDDANVPFGVEQPVFDAVEVLARTLFVVTILA